MEEYDKLRAEKLQYSPVKENEDDHEEEEVFEVTSEKLEEETPEIEEKQEVVPDALS